MFFVSLFRFRSLCYYCVLRIWNKNKKIVGNYRWILRAILNKAWKQHPRKEENVRPHTSHLVEEYILHYSVCVNNPKSIQTQIRSSGYEFLGIVYWSNRYLKQYSYLIWNVRNYAKIKCENKRKKILEHLQETFNDSIIFKLKINLHRLTCR